MPSSHSKRISLLLIALFLLVSFSKAARVDTVMVPSAAMHKTVKVVYIIPDKALASNPSACPVIYLLHGYNGNAKTWLGIKPNLPQIADEKGIIFVCPDGKNSWYWDSPKNPAYRYETFTSQELVTYTDAHYATIANRTARAITGLSMGGHGALWVAFRHKQTFGAAGSTSGGVDIRPFPKNWLMSKQLGSYENNKTVWDNHTVVTQLDSIQPGDLSIIIDCGRNDFFLPVNQELHELLLKRSIAHDFIVRLPGTHRNWYWNNSIDFQILFFEKFFQHTLPMQLGHL